MQRRILKINATERSYRTIDLDLDSLMPISVLLANNCATDNKFREVINKDFLVVGTGALGGYSGVGLSITTLTGISPQSGRLIEAKIEGKLASTLRGLGLDAVSFEGIASQLLGIRIYREGATVKVEFKDASGLQGSSVWETTKAIKTNQNSVLTIGKPGEEEAISASVVSDYGFPTQTGGVGAIFGRLHIKYIDFESGKVPYAGPITSQISSEYLDGIRAGNILSKFHYDPPGYGVYVGSTLSGYLGGGNFATKLPKETGKFDPQDYINRLAPDQEPGCPGCIQNCLKVIGASAGSPPDGFRVHQIGVTVFASQWADSDPDRALRFNSYCHEVGVEHLYVSALLIQENPQRELPVEELVDFVYKKRLELDALTVKGMPLPPFDPRGNQGLGVAMALNPAGPRYDVIEHDIDFDPHWSWVRHSIFGQEFGYPEGGLPVATLDTRRHQPIIQVWKLWSALDALGVCIFASPPTRDLRLSHIYATTKEITDHKLDRESLFDLGLTRLSLQRILNGLLGGKFEEDSLPNYFYDNPIAAELKESDGPIFGNDDVSGIVNSKLYSATLSRADFEAARTAIYDEFGWSRDGSVDMNHSISKRATQLQGNFNDALINAN